MMQCKKSPALPDSFSAQWEIAFLKSNQKVLDHDFPIEELGKVAPYGVYILNDNTAFVNLGISHDTSLEIHVTHFQSGTSKWNKIEHILFCSISKNWAGKLLVDVETVIYMISNTSTNKGLKVVCVPDNNEYLAGKKVDDKEFDSINIIKIPPHDEWNYIILSAK